MNDILRRYLLKRKRDLEIIQLRKTIKELNQTQSKVAPMIRESIKADKARRSVGDGFVILDK